MSKDGGKQPCHVEPDWQKWEYKSYVYSKDTRGTKTGIWQGAYFCNL